MPAEYVNFEELKRATTIEYVASWMGLDLKNQNNQLRGPCPKNGGSRCLVITPAIQSFYCHSPKCGCGGDMIALISHVQGIEVREAALLLQNHLWPKTQELKELEYLIAQCERVQSLGLPAHVATAIGAGYAPRGILAGRVAIPMRLPSGKLVAYVGIGLDLEPEVKFPKQFYL
jgi:hypothetical protein